jgi:outer membrane lipase/esterase
MTKLKKFFGWRICLFFSCLLPLPVSAQSIDGVTTFGDSLSDNGNAFGATGGTVPPSPPYFNGRFSNGPVWIENFTSGLKLAPGASSNFAFGGATSGTANTVNNALPGLTTELDRFLLASPRVNPNQLFVVWIGANDYLGGGVTNPAIVVGNISTSLQRLTGAGAQQLLVANLPDLGRIPAGAAGGAIQSAGLSQLTAAHNSALRTSLQTLSQNNPNLSIVPTDLASLFSSAIANPARFGFVDVTQPCLNAATGAVCANPDTNLFWDALHPTAAGHRLIGAYALDTVIAPRTIATQVETAFGIASQPTRDLNNRLLTLRTTNPQPNSQVSVFVNGEVNYGDRTTTNNNTGFRIDTKGVTVGADYALSPNIIVGVAYSSANTDNRLNDNRGKVAVSNSSFSVYGSYNQAKFYTDALFNYGWNDFKIDRTIQVPGFTQANGNPNGTQLSARLNSGYDLGSNGLSFGPIAGIRYTKIKIGGYTEQNGDLLNLKVSPQEADSLILNLGAQISYPFKTTFATISPYFAANFEHEFAQNDRQVVTELVTQPGISQRTNIAANNRDFIRLSTGIQTELSSNLSVNLGYETVLGKDNFSDNYFNAKIRLQF